LKLGEAMVKEGLITNDTLARALERQIIFGGRLGTNLIEMGAISEENLARFLGRVLGVPYAGPAQFEEVPQDALEAVKAELVEKYIIFPLKKERSRLHLAMKDPNDIAMVDELRFVLGTEIKGYIASEIRILYALEKYYGIKRDLRYVSILEEEETWDAKSAPHDIVDLPKEPVNAAQTNTAQEATAPAPEYVKPVPEPPAPGRVEPAVTGPVEPSPEPVKSEVQAPAPSAASAHPEPPAPIAAPAASAWTAVSVPAPVKSPQSPFEILASPLDRESIAEAVVMAAVEKLSRVALFRVKEGVLSGWRCALSGAEADISRLAIKIDLPCIFKEVVEEKSLYKGPVVPLPKNDMLMDALGGNRPLEAVACPLVIKDKVVAVLYGDNGPGSMTRCETDFFISLMSKAAISLEILILKNKILS
jgi:MshEN domain